MIKNKNDSRVRKNRESFFWAFAKVKEEKKPDDTIRMVDVYRTANKSRATFRRHFRNVGDMIEQKEAEMMEEFERVNLTGPDELVWRRILIFIAKNRKFFEYEFSQDGSRFVRKMLEKYRQGTGKIFVRYEAKLNQRLVEMSDHEMYCFLKFWVMDGANINEIKKVTERIKYIEYTIDKRWSSFLG